MKSRTLVLLLSVLAAFAAIPIARSQVVYSNDFEAFTSTGFQAPSTNFITLPTDGSAIETPAATSVFFQPSAQNQTLRVTGLTPSTTYTLTFDLFIGRSWDGNSTAFFNDETLGPDNFTLSAATGFVNNIPFSNTFHQQNFVSLLNTSFTNSRPSDAINNDYTQNYSDTNLLGAGSSPYLTGADVMHDDSNIFLRYGIYYFSHGAGNPVLNFITGSSSTVAEFQFFAAGQGISDEFWAVDNVQVSVATAVPEPAAMALLTGLSALGVFAWHRRRVSGRF